MKTIGINEALKYSSPHQVSVISAVTPEGITNLTPVAWWTYLESEPAMVGFSIGKENYAWELVTKNRRAVLSLPGEAIAKEVLLCGDVSGRDVNKAEKFGIELVDAPVKYPVHSRLVFICTVEKTVDVGDCRFFICKADEILFNENERHLYAAYGSSGLVTFQ
jgi:flavin reductase (DIM6/NTAB) family NADH-FMN oxidoreductase RutF